jgi:carboxyl-terminal processing protease
MPRFRTAAAATLLLVPMVAGGFLLQEPPVRTNALFSQVRAIVEQKFVDTLPRSATYEKAARGLVRELNDPYSELLSPKQSEAFTRSTGGRYGGIGMALGEASTGEIFVQRVFPNTPAEEAGVREGDRILQVDTTLVAKLNITAISELLRGTPGSQITVTYARPGMTEHIKLRFTRRVVRVPAVAYTGVYGGEVGYIPLQTFNENAADEVRVAIENLTREGAKGLVLDMRDNGGGIVEQALETASLFLRDGQEIASVRSRNQPTEVLRSSGRHVAPTIPLVVLLDGGSASATEIVAGALQDHDRALVIGSNSFGKGLVQSVFPLSDGYHLKITTGKWFTPSGRSIHRERKLMPNGAFVEVHPDSIKGDTARRPKFKSDGGRTVFGGGGIRPDLLVADDTLVTPERDFLRAAAPQLQAINTVLQNYALELKGSVAKGFTVPATWTPELMQRLDAAKVKIDPKHNAAARVFLTRDLVNRVARLSFGEAAAKERSLASDHQLVRAIELLKTATSQSQLLAATPQQQ